MTGLIALLMAAAAIAAQPTPPPADFDEAVLRCDTPVYQPGTFIGCESHDGDEDLYAGLIWVDGQPSLQTGP